MPNTLRKQPAEKFYVGVNFEALLADGESIELTQSQVVAYDMANGSDVSAEMIEAGTLSLKDETILQARVIGGVDGKKYKLSFRAATSLGNLYEEDVILVVKD